MTKVSQFITIMTGLIVDRRGRVIEQIQGRSPIDGYSTKVVPRQRYWKIGLRVEYGSASSGFLSIMEQDILRKR